MGRPPMPCIACNVPTLRDVDWVIERVRLGEPVWVRTGGLRRPRSMGLNATQALCQLEYRLQAIGADLKVDTKVSAVTRSMLGRTALAVPSGPQNPDLTGVREPRNPIPAAPPFGAALDIPR